MQVVTLKRANWTWARITEFTERNFGRKISRSTCQRILRKYERTGTVSDLPRSGRPPALNVRQQRLVRREMLKDRRKTLRQMSSELKNLGFSASRMTIRRVLSKYRLGRRVAVRRPLLTKRMRQSRLNWAEQHKNWSVDKWKGVVFTDEKIFRVGNNAHGVFVTRSPTEKYEPQCIQRTVKHGLQVHVWGIIGWNGVGSLKLVKGNLTAEAYRRTVINDIGRTGRAVANRNRRFVFQQDSAPAHTAASTRQFLKRRKIEILPWCGNSPDLNPIENVWSQVARTADYSATTADELFANVRRAWLNTPLSYIRRLYHSMPRRVAEVIKRRGGSTKY